MVNKKRRKDKKLRYLSYISRFIVLFLFVFLINGSLSGFKLGGFSIITPPEGFMYIVSNPGYSIFKIILYMAPWIIGTILLGRVFCGYICPVGLIIDIGVSIRDRITGRKLISRRKLTINGNYIIYVGGIIFLIIISMNVFLHSQFLNWTVSPFADFIKVLYSFPYLSIELIFLILILALSIIYPRLWCRAFCPAGFVFTILSILNKKKLLSFVIDEKLCTECGICGLVCPVGVCPLDQSPACVYCLECCDRCPVNAIKLKFIGPSEIVTSEKKARKIPVIE